MFGRKGKRSRSVSLDILITIFGQSITFWESQNNSSILARARIADACRDQEVRPVSKEVFDASWQILKTEDQARFCMMISSLDVKESRSRVGDLCFGLPNGEKALSILQTLAQRLTLLTVDVLAQSDIRLEEFARHFCVDWGLTVNGESDAQSASRLHEIDFARLMREADAARSSAEDRLAYLRKIQEEQEETRRPRRGKW